MKNLAKIYLSICTKKQRNPRTVILSETKNERVWVWVLTLTSPATAPSSASLMGDFGKRLFERSEFPLTAQQAEQRRKKAVGGSLFFGFFLLATQKKETR